jgi:hypothetical protein
VATFETTDRAQVRRCRGAQLHGRIVNEAFQIARDPMPAAGYVHAIRPDLFASPLKWTIVIEGEKTTPRQKDKHHLRKETDPRGTRIGGPTPCQPAERQVGCPILQPS